MVGDRSRCETKPLVMLGDVRNARLIGQTAPHRQTEAVSHRRVRLWCHITIGRFMADTKQKACNYAALHNMTEQDDFRDIVIKGCNAMRRPDQQEPSRNTTPNGTSLAAWLPVLAAMAIMVTGCLSTFLILQLDEFRPKVGDIVVFRPGSPDSDMWQMSIPATSVSAMSEPVAECSLDPNVMAASGGSLVVEGLQNDPSLRYRLHWAGSETARAGGNCGLSADLLVSRTDLQRLANAAGGFGIGDKGLVR
jgi:hypothetical protein